MPTNMTDWILTSWSGTCCRVRTGVCPHIQARKTPQPPTRTTTCFAGKVHPFRSPTRDRPKRFFVREENGSNLRLKERCTRPTTPAAVALSLLFLTPNRRLVPFSLRGATMAKPTGDCRRTSSYLRLLLVLCTSLHGQGTVFTVSPGGEALQVR